VEREDLIRVSLEVDVLLELCGGRGRHHVLHAKIAEELGIAEAKVMVMRARIYDKAGLSTQRELFEFVKTALNGECGVA